MTPVKEVALAHNLPVYQPEKMSGSDEMAELMTLGADGIVTAAFGQFLPTKLLDSVDFAVNVHASLLPKYRGGAPIHYAIINGDKEAGVTIMEMVKKMDAGDMIAKASTPITDEDNVGTMFEKLAVIGRDLLLKTLPDYIAGNIKPEPQDESKATFSPNITPEEERIDWNNQRVRSLTTSVVCIHGLLPTPFLMANVSKSMKQAWQKVKDNQVKSLKKARKLWLWQLETVRFLLKQFNQQGNHA